MASVRTPKHGLTQVRKKGVPAGWVKRINRKPKWVCSIAQAPTPEAADAYYSRHHEHLWTEPAPGEPAPPGPADDPAAQPLHLLANAFLAHKRRRMAAGKLDPRTYDRYKHVLAAFLAVAGRETPAGQLGPAHFMAYREGVEKRHGWHGTKDRVLAVRSLFKWASLPPVRLPLPDYGEGLALPSKRDYRRERKVKREARGLLMFSPAEIRAQLEGATVKRRNGRPMTVKPTPALRAAILLGINCGYGNTDIATLPLSVVAAALESGWIEFARGKTGADRRAWLWPETADALRRYLKFRPKPRRPAYAGLCFLTREGQPYVRNVRDAAGEHVRVDDKLGERYRKLLRRLGQHRAGVGWYSLRRTCRTIAAETGQERAIDLVLGHSESADDQGATYTLVIADEVIRSVLSHVRSRLFP
jgi:integrase